MNKDEDQDAKERDLERRHREGYERNPVEPGEFGDCEDDDNLADVPAELRGGADEVAPALGDHATAFRLVSS
jgi:hypothetical protein